MHQLHVELLGDLALLGLGRVDQVGDVEVAVADVADDVVLQAARRSASSDAFVTDSARREIGTQVSVVTVRQPGFICRPAK